MLFVVAGKRKYITISTVLTLAVFAAFVLCLLCLYHYFSNISERMACGSYLSSMAACLQENQKTETMFLEPMMIIASPWNEPVPDGLKE
jgi:hypothetical protein